ncbi:hypothetical protein SteCoe_33688 [Stentor coeruleus]|uniref:DNA 3'-5' helicase n=1 Tax=Stentor coeruleus TaxID=5963 RepID=A0A1R2AW80_9CILI|nr:hypothetical protein SteCoe_33688 [Stentor coeruleus]
MAFVPSAGFYEVPGGVQKKNLNSQRIQRPPITNKLANTIMQVNNEDKVVSPVKTTCLYESVVVKLLKAEEKEIIENDCGIEKEFPLKDDEIQGDEIIRVAIEDNFVKVKPSAVKESVQKPKKVKHVENFVRTNMSRSKSSKKMGQTGCPKKKFRYFTPSAQIQDDFAKMIFSSGYKNRKRSTEASLEKILEEEFQFSSFRPGQKESLEYILQNNNTLTILPTGTGKSLIYQMASRILGGLTIVISPLLSLISDQIQRLPNCLSAAAFYSNLSYSHYHQILSDIKEGHIDIVYVTPEKFISEALYTIKNISLICIDEAHCVSKFSTSTRLSFLQLPRLLGQVKILALTAAIDTITEEDLMSLLKITKKISLGRALRENLTVTVSREDDILTAAGKLVKTERFKKGSLIIYCSMQYMADSVAQWLKSKGELCMSYHSGHSEARRGHIQEDFITGKIRIIVATVAFGMGIDKSNIAGVIHIHMPQSLEQFIQESGRAGRNGSKAHIHVMISESTLYFLRSLIYANHISKKQIIQLIKIMRPSNSKRSRDEDFSQGPRLTLKISAICEETGLSKERLLSLFHHFIDKGLIKDLSISPITVNVSFHKTPPEVLASKFAIISHILNIGKKLAGSRKIDLVALSAKVSLKIIEVVKVLKRLAATGEIFVEFSDDAFIIDSGIIPEDMALISFATSTEEHFFSIENVFRKKIETCFMIFDQVAKDFFNDCQDVNNELSELIEDYLHKGYYDEIPEDNLPDISADVHCLEIDIDGIPEAKDISCILQGIHTERTPMSRWKASHLWGRFRKFRYDQVYNAVNEVLMEEMGSRVKFKHSESEFEIVEND